MEEDTPQHCWPGAARLDHSDSVARANGCDTVHNRVQSGTRKAWGASRADPMLFQPEGERNTTRHTRSPCSAACQAHWHREIPQQGTAMTTAVPDRSDRGDSAMAVIVAVVAATAVEVVVLMAVTTARTPGFPRPAAATSAEKPQQPLPKYSDSHPGGQHGRGGPLLQTRTPRT